MKAALNQDTLALQVRQLDLHYLQVKLVHTNLSHIRMLPPVSSITHIMHNKRSLHTTGVGIGVASAPLNLGLCSLKTKASRPLK